MSEKKLSKEEQIQKFLSISEKAFKKQYEKTGTKFVPMADELPPTGILLDNPLMEKLYHRRFLPYGRCYMSYGLYRSAKTTYFFDLAKLFLRNEGVVLWLETENSADKDFARKQGVDLAKIRISHPQTLEEALTATKCFVDSMPTAFPDGDVPVLICLDSIAGSQTEWETSQEVVGTSKPGSHAKILSEFYRQFSNDLSHEKCVFLVINQLKHKVGGFTPVFGGEVETMIGGEAVRFANTYQFKFDKTGDILIPNPEHPAVKMKIGSSHKITCKRNKLGLEGNSEYIEVDNMTEGGFTWYESLVDTLGKQYKAIMDKNGAYCQWNIPDTHFFNPISKEVEVVDTEKNYLRRDMATILANSEEAKETIRAAFKIPDLPTIEEVTKVEESNKKERNKKKTEVKTL